MIDTSHTVTELVNLAKQGDRDARGELFLRYQMMVLSTIYKRTHNHADAQELVPEVFLQAFKKLDILREPKCFGSWLRSIAIRTSINLWVYANRSRTITFSENIAENQNTRRHPLPVSIDEVVCEYTDAPDERMLQQEQADCLHAGISRLGKIDRDALTAFYFHHHSYSEMSRQFGIPLGTVKSRLNKARNRLAVELEGSMSA